MVHRIGQQDDELLQGGGPALAQNTVPSAPGGIANVGGAPLSQAGANESQVGGAVSPQQATTAPLPPDQANQRPDLDLMKDRDKPDKHFVNMAQKNPQVLDDALTEASTALEKEKASGARASNEDREKLATALESNGANEKSFNQMKADIIKGLDRAIEDGEIPKNEGKKYKLHWRNVFQKIEKDEMGLFLMDFGLRTMIAGETMGSAGAIGAGGAGALQGLQGRRQLERTQTLEVEQQAHDMTVEQYDSETKRKRADYAGQGYRGEKAWLYDLGKRIGKTDEQIYGMFNKEESMEVRRQKAFEFIREVQADAGIIDRDPMLDKEYRDFEPEDFEEWVDMVLEQETRNSATGSALSRPSGMDEYLNQ